MLLSAWPAKWHGSECGQEISSSLAIVGTRESIVKSFWLALSERRIVTVRRGKELPTGTRVCVL